MMKHPISDHDKALWDQFVKTYNEHFQAGIDFYKNVSNRIDVVRSGLYNPIERKAALNVASHLEIEELKEIFGDLVNLASYSHGLIPEVRRLILTLPRQWLLEAI